MYGGVVCFFFKQKTADEMRISDWSSDVCSSDLRDRQRGEGGAAHPERARRSRDRRRGEKHRIPDGGLARARGEDGRVRYDGPGAGGGDRSQDRKSVV